MNLNEFKKSVYNKDVSVIGLGISNRPLIKYLVKLGANVTGYDRRTKEQLGEIFEELSGLGVRLVLGESYLDDLKSVAGVFGFSPGEVETMAASGMTPDEIESCFYDGWF